MDNNKPQVRDLNLARIEMAEKIEQARLLLQAAKKGNLKDFTKYWAQCGNHNDTDLLSEKKMKTNMLFVRMVNIVLYNSKLLRINKIIVSLFCEENTNAEGDLQMLQILYPKSFGGLTLKSASKLIEDGEDN